MSAESDQDWDQVNGSGQPDESLEAQAESTPEHTPEQSVNHETTNLPVRNTQNNGVDAAQSSQSLPQLGMQSMLNALMGRKQAPQRTVTTVMAEDAPRGQHDYYSLNQPPREQER